MSFLEAYMFTYCTKLLQKVYMASYVHGYLVFNDEYCSQVIIYVCLPLMFHM